MDSLTVGMFLALLLMACACEYIDSALGMGYGTILTPVLLLLGFDPLIVVPAVLITQAFGGLAASVFHHKFDNISIKKDSEHLKIILVICAFGFLATIGAALISVQIPKLYLKTYIGCLVLTMGILILLNRQFQFSMRKMMVLGVISAFNKGISGGGFGPVITGGQIVSGQKHKSAIGITTAAEAPICLIGAFTYLIAKGFSSFDGEILSVPFDKFLHAMFSSNIFNWQVILALFIGSVLIAPFGAFTTKFLDKHLARFATGIIITVLGAWTLIKIWI